MTRKMLENQPFVTFMILKKNLYDNEQLTTFHDTLIDIL